MKMKPVAAALVTAGVVIAASGAGAWGLGEMLERTPAVASSTVPAEPATSTAPTELQAATAPGSAATTVAGYRDIVQAYGPAVVGITAAGTRQADVDDEPEDVPQHFRGMPGMPFGGPRGDAPFRGQGSGFIISADGLILTNAHVVRGASEVTVKLSDRREFRAKLLGLDTATDVAVLKVDAQKLPAVALGDARQVQVGDPVLAIGSPFGFEQTATQGIVSAKARSLPGASYVPFIQTDAAVNPGNSGGPLFDAKGRVIGINSQIYSRSGGFQGLAFAIPIDVALNVKDQIVTHGKVEHARLGVTLQDLNQGLAETFGLKTPDGAIVSSVANGTAAAKAELKPGDVITKMDGEAVRASGDVSSRVGMAKPGQKMKLTVWRDKANVDVDVILGAAEGTMRQAASEAPKGRLGLALRPLSEAEKRQLRTEQGLVVEDASGPAERAGIQPGDVVLSMNGQPVESAEQMRAALEKKPSNVALLIQRDSQRIFVPIKLG
ncbi:MAG: DegQ family serine endoprotease [Burkholderiaceae bacterium]